MKLKIRLILLLIILAGSFLFITFRLLAKLENYPNELHDNLHNNILTDHPTHNQQERSLSHKTQLTTEPSLQITTQSLVYESAHQSLPSPWEVWSSWVEPTILFRTNNFYSPEMGNILSALSSYPVTRFDVGHRGTQLKTTMYLKGGQKTVFKPKRLINN